MDDAKDRKTEGVERPDAVTVVRNVLSKRMSGGVFFDDELSDVQAELKVLQERELRVKNLGGMYAHVEMSSYVRDMLKELMSRQPVQST